MNQQLSEIKEALSKATQGEWRIEEGGMDDAHNIVVYENGKPANWIGEFGFQNEDADAHLIANAPQWLTSLVSEVEVWEKTSIKLHKKLELQSTFILEMQKTLVEIANMRPSICTWSDEEYYENFSKCEEIAQQTIQSLKGDKP